MTQLDFAADQDTWLAEQLEALTVELEHLTPSEWAEKRRYLPANLSPMPGYYRFQTTPYLKEIVDCLSTDSPVREVAVMKGVQIGATVGVLENAIGYCVDFVKTAPVMLVTADAELAQQRMGSNIIPMLQHSELEHLIKSADTKNARKSGRTDKKIEWVGGGFLIPFGAQNANKLRSVSIQYLLRDEVDGWPDTVGKDGDPIKLSADRTAAFEASRKIVDISTPLIKGQSKIEPRFKRGDQRYYMVRCLACGYPQRLRWRHTDQDTGEVTGIVWETEGGRLVPDSVRYLCQQCAHPHTNDDKVKLLSPDYGAEWVPTAEPVAPDIRSYHLSALYSPVGMQTWAACVHHWLQAWDDEHNRPRDNGQLQVFYNNVLGETFELRGEKLRFESVSPHRRSCYRLGEIPNKFAEQYCGSKVLLLTCAVDVHKDNLAVAVFGWCRGRRVFLVDYWRFEGDTQQLDDAPTWGRLRDLIERNEYRADDGTQYRIQVCLVDSGYLTDQVYQFASGYEVGVFPVKGREISPKTARQPEFSEFATPMGTRAFGITVDLYKDRWSASLKRSWDGQSQQPQGHFNAPIDITDAQLKELTVEVKREKIEKTTGKRIGFEWHRPGGANNELWDCLVYGNAALDMLGYDMCRAQLDMEWVNWTAFYDRCEEGAYFTG